MIKPNPSSGLNLLLHVPLTGLKLRCKAEIFTDEGNRLVNHEVIEELDGKACVFLLCSTD